LYWCNKGSFSSGSIDVLGISKNTHSPVSDDFKISLLADNPSLKFRMNLSEAIYGDGEASWIWVIYVNIIF
jgi:hypothetical protein